MLKAAEEKILGTDHVVKEHAESQYQKYPFAQIGGSRLFSVGHQNPLFATAPYRHWHCGDTCLNPDDYPPIHRGFPALYLMIPASLYARRAPGWMRFSSQPYTRDW